MSNISYSGGFPGSTVYQYGGFGYGAGISIGILIIITTITFASYYCTREEQPPSTAAINGRIPTMAADPERFVAVDVGLDDDTIKSYRKLLYSEVNLQNNYSDRRTAAGCCSICLDDYHGSDELRQLPECGHLFHSKCIDTWLRLHPTCPFCRTSPSPTPLATPLAEVVPLVSGGGDGRGM